MIDNKELAAVSKVIKSKGSQNLLENFQKTFMEEKMLKSLKKIYKIILK